MADAEVSKTSLFGGVGSSPTSGTMCAVTHATWITRKGSIPYQVPYWLLIASAISSW